MTDNDQHDQAVESFEDLNLDSKLIRGIFAYGFERPSIIQKKGIKPVLDGHDVIGQAQSGTGKTATFVIASLQKINYASKAMQVLILGPTRELAQQIQKVCLALGDHLKVACHACVGGTDFREDIKALQSGVQLVVGTPGRVLDMLDTRKVMNTAELKLFVLDEADEMLSRGFKMQIHEIFQFLPEHAQIALFSATMPPQVLELTGKFMKNPKQILVK